MAAAAVMGALTVAVLDWGCRDEEDTLAARLLGALDVLDPQPASREPR